MRGSVVSAPVPPVAALTLILVVDRRRVRSRGAGKSASVEGGVGTDCVCVCELDSWVCRLDGDTARRGGERYNGGVGASNESRYVRMLGARANWSAISNGGKYGL